MCGLSYTLSWGRGEMQNITAGSSSQVILFENYYLYSEKIAMKRTQRFKPIIVLEGNLISSVLFW